MNNSLYGKTLENVENHCKIQFVFDRERLLKKSAKINYRRSTIFNEDCAALHMTNSTIKYDKFNYICFVVLELSKLQMYDFVYNHVDKQLSPNYKIHYTYNDIIFLEIACKYNEDVKDKLKLIRCKLGRGLRQFQDEAKGGVIKSFVVNKAKSYNYEKLKRTAGSCRKYGIVNKPLGSVHVFDSGCNHVCNIMCVHKCDPSCVPKCKHRCDEICNCRHRCNEYCDDECRLDSPTTIVCNHVFDEVTEGKKLKGIPKSSYRHIHHKDYQHVVTGVQGDIYVETVRLKSKLHHMYMIKQRKLALNTLDDKRYI